MNIDTELVKRKSFEEAIKPRLLKTSLEYRTLATLRFLYPGQFNNMFKSESPDLQDLGKRIGIEVTTAVKEEDMKATRKFSELCQTDYIDKKSVKFIDNNGYLFGSYLNKRVMWISRSGTVDEEKRILIGAVQKKSTLISEYRRDFNCIGLAIILHNIPTSCAENHIIDWLSEGLIEGNENFDFFYVISPRFCIYFDLRSKNTEKRLIKQEERIALSKIGRMTAEGELTMDSKEWKSN